MGWYIIAYPQHGVSMGQHYKDWVQVQLAQDRNRIIIPPGIYMSPCSQVKPQTLINLVPVTKALFSLQPKLRFLPKFRIQFWSECVNHEAHLELRRFSYSGWKKWVSDPDLPLNQMNCSLNSLLWGLAAGALGARSKVTRIQLVALAHC